MTAPSDPKQARHDFQPLTDTLYKEVWDALSEEGQTASVVEVLLTLHPSDIAELIDKLPPDKRELIVPCIPKDVLGEVLSETSDAAQEGLVEQLANKDLKQAFKQLDSDDVVDIVQNMDGEVAEKAIKALSKEEKQLVKYEEDTAGSLMQLEVYKVPLDWTVGDVMADFQKPHDSLPDNIHSVFITSPDSVLVGSISLSRLVRLKAKEKLLDVMRQNTYRSLTSEDVDSVIEKFEKYDLIDCAVVDEAGRLVGMMTIDDVIDEVEERHEKEQLRSAGLDGSQDVFAPVSDITKQRLPWLIVNLFTAVLASLVIALFEEQIATLVALAVLMPIVASMGGNAGTQTLTVTVRAIGMGQVTWQNAFILLKKELTVGSFNGLFLAVLLALGAWLVYGNLMLGVVIATATVIVHVLAAIAGYLIPVTLNKLGKDPAVSSGVLLTTITDVGGFFAFLGLAAVLLL